MSAADIAAIGGGIAAVVTLPFAIVAGVYAVRTYRRQGDDGDAATRRWLSSVQPRPSVHIHHVAETVCEFAVINTGGSAVEWVTVWSFAGHVFRTMMPVKQQHQQVGEFFRAPSLGPLPLGVPDREVFVSVARDVHDEWWDCISGKRIEGSHAVFLLEEFARFGIASLLQGPSAR